MNRPPRILVLTARSNIPSMRGVFEELLEAGAELIFGAVGRTNTERALRALEHPLVSAAALPLRRTGPGAEAVKRFRALSGLVQFMHPELAEAQWPRVQAAAHALTVARVKDEEARAESFRDLVLPAPAHEQLDAVLVAIEAALPPEVSLVDALAELDVDAVLCITRGSRKRYELDLLKAARTLGLPSLMLLVSWDNLIGGISASKAVLHVHPDHLLVWNEMQADQAVTLNGFRPEQVFVVGAPTFDRFFALCEEAATSRKRTRGSEPATIAYLGSRKASPDEPAIFREWLEAVRSAEDSMLRQARVVVRPHPSEATRWQEAMLPADELLTVQIPAKHETETLASVLTRADAAAALITTAELEAAIAGCPVVTFRAGDAAPVQDALLHFKILLEERGGFVVDSLDLQDHVEKLARVLHGEYDGARIRGFVERFIRPAGLGRPVAPLVASRVLDLIAQAPAVPSRPPAVAEL